MSDKTDKTRRRASVMDRRAPTVAARINAAAMAWINAGGSADSFSYYRTEIEARINEINASADGRGTPRTVEPVIGQED